MTQNPSARSPVRFGFVGVGGIARSALLPAVRKADAKTLVVADGTSCRHQIHDGTGRDALHVARVLAMSLQ